jgi:general secretion pathway protein L
MLGGEEAGMQVSNILSLLKTNIFDFDRPLFKHNSFLELASGTYQEIYIESGKCTLIEKSKACFPFETRITKVFTNIIDLAENLHPNRKIILSVSTVLCFQNCVQFPIAARLKIDQLSKLELQRVTPFELVHVYHGCTIAGENETTIFTQQFVLKKAIVSEIEEQLSFHKKSIEAVFMRDPSSRAIELAFAPNGEFFGRQSFEKWNKRLGMAIGVFAIGTAALFAGIHSFHARQYEEISGAIASLEPGIKKIKQTIESTEKRNTNVIAIQKLQRETISRLAIIEEVTRVLPDTAYVLNLSVVDNRVQLEGLANSPEKLIPSLESSSSFKNVVFGSAVFNLPGDTQSHFAINMDLEQAK